MAKEAATAKDGQFVLVSQAPDVCLTPIGDKVVPIPYSIVHNMSLSEQVSPNVFFAGEPAFLHGQSFVDKVSGDEPGTKGGVVSTVNGKISHAIDKSPTVYVNGQPLVRTADTVWMNGKKP